ncbi:MAG: FAD-binding oxidoreductase, partial [Cyanobacteria bacterium J06643_5]
LLQIGDTIRIGDFVVLFEFEQSILDCDDQILSDANTLIIPNTNQQQQPTEFIVKCCDIVEETDNVKTFRLVAEPPILFNDVSFNYKPGQFVMLDLEIGGKQVKRPYSISSSPSRPYNLEITVKRVSAPQNQPYLSPGLVSNWLHDYFKVGDQLKISPPMGDFNYFEDFHK